MYPVDQQIKGAEVAKVIAKAIPEHTQRGTIYVAFGVNMAAQMAHDKDMSIENVAAEMNKFRDFVIMQVVARRAHEEAEKENE